MAGADLQILDFSFFTLEYSDGIFMRRLPSGAEDLGGGRFRYGGAVLALPEPDPSDPEHALALPRIGGKALLSLLRRGRHPLVIDGPRFAPREEGLMELALDDPATGGRGPESGRSGGYGAGRQGGGAGGPLRLVLRRKPGIEGLLLEGLPNYRFHGGAIYEIIGEAELALLAESFGAGGGTENDDGETRLVLRGEEIPRFADSHARLVYRFGDPALRRRLSEEAVFVPAGELSLVLSVVTDLQRGVGRPRALPLLKRGRRRYPALELSLLLDREFVLLEDRWARREDLEGAGLLPMGYYAGGEAVAPVKPEAVELLRRGGPRFDGRFSGFELDEGLWKSRGSGEEIFAAHLEFLRTFGLSGGAGLSPHGDQGRALLHWLGELRGKAGGAAVMVLMERRYYDLYFAPLLPCSDAGAEIRFYDDLRNAAGLHGSRKTGPDILVLIEPEEVLFDEGRDRADEALIAEIRALEPALLLGIFSDTWHFLNDPGRQGGWQSLRALFGIRAAGNDTAKYLFRNAAAALPLPEAHVFPPPALLRPPGRNGAPAPFFSAVEEKFRRLPTGDLLSELSLFGDRGGKAPFVPPGSEVLFFDRMDQGERAYFLYWRGAFREGRDLKTAEAYIRLYVRELCLFTGKEGCGSGSPGSGPPEGGVEKNFRDLLRLWRTYRGDFPRLDGDLLRWLYDYAVLYDIGDTALPLLFPFVHDGPCPPLADRYLYRTFIEENNGIGFADILPLIGTATAGSVFFPFPKTAVPPDAAGTTGAAMGPLLARDYTAVVNGADRFLREHFRLKFFEFFYPPAAYQERRRALEGLPLTGDSFYTDGGARFSLHRPLTAFLDAFFRYTEYRFKIRTGYEKPRQTPPLEEVWRNIADAVLEGRDERSLAAPARYAGASLRDTPPDQGAAGPVSAEPGSGGPLFLFRPAPPRLVSGSIDRLREESNQVRGLLLHREETAGRPETAKTPEAPEPRLSAGDRPPDGPGTLPGDSGTFPNGPGPVQNGPAGEDGGGMAAFLAGLDAAGTAILGLIAGGEPKEALDALARRHGTMAEPVIDSINEQFLGAFGDLLIETMDERPRIVAEYKETVKTILARRPENGPEAAGR
ncbi:MAG: hypothetical protein LBS06_05750 [Treponema sp.]|jgi:hypothetical protein|nr:hypothetical protein [Treponema sp.]